MRALCAHTQRRRARGRRPVSCGFWAGTTLAEWAAQPISHSLARRTSMNRTIAAAVCGTTLFTLASCAPPDDVESSTPVESVQQAVVDFSRYGITDWKDLGFGE